MTEKIMYKIASDIWRSLGGQLFSVVTGCKMIAFGEKDYKVYLLMSVGSNKEGIDRFEVASNGSGYYDVRFIRKRGTEAKVVASYKGVEMSMVHTIFKQQTGITFPYMIAYESRRLSA